MKHPLLLVLPIVLMLNASAWSASPALDADLLIVGGTESGCAAAVQAARMGVKKIVLVNDIEWLGGQFSAEALVAIDENRGPQGYDHTVPFPRNGAFREVIDRIESLNKKKYGVARPGNTRVITTCRPADAAQVFTDWLAPYVARGKIEIRSHYEPRAIEVREGRVVAVRFVSTKETQDSLTVAARLTIDASDWGDVIRLSGAEYEFGPDLKSKYGEPLAPAKRASHPVTDMNPITYCMVVVEDDKATPIEAPAGYDERNYIGNKAGARYPIPYGEWQYPADIPWLYESRRVIDHYNFTQIDHPDVLLLCFPAFDYPLDVWPQALADALEADQPGASKKNIVQLDPRQRRMVFENAKNYSLGFLHYLQTRVHDRLEDKARSLRRFRLSNEFGTADRLPPKPYVRESLRMKAAYMMRQQDTSGVGGDAKRYARCMYHDSVAAWQFEYDFHPTGRKFIDDGDPAGPWQNYFREGRRWGPPYSGLSVFPLRSLIPRKLDGLLGAQKNLGYSSIVSSAVRLHDQSMAIGQASGAAAALSIRQEVAPRTIPLDRDLLAQLQEAIATAHDGGMPSTIWPYRDVTPTDAAFTAINILAVQGCLPILGDDVEFRADQLPSREWMEAVVTQTHDQLAANANFEKVDPPWNAKTRGQFAAQWWRSIRGQPWRPYLRKTENDADGDGIADHEDPLMFNPNSDSLAMPPLSPLADGMPGPLPDGWMLVKQFNFARRNAGSVEGFVADHGDPFEAGRGRGWGRDISTQVRQRGRADLLADTFLFTRTHDVWECLLENGSYHVVVSVGDSDHEQFGQNVTIEGTAVFRDLRTSTGRFAEKAVTVEVRDRRLSVEIGLPGSKTNTCINWLRIARDK